MKTTHCKSCGAEIVWAKSPNGKAAPYQAAIGGRWKIENGVAKYVRPGEADADAVRYSSHFATCPQASTWRK